MRTDLGPGELCEQTWVHSGVVVASIQTCYKSIFLMKVSIKYNSTRMLFSSESLNMLWKQL